MRTDPTGRLDILLGGIIARVAQQNPVLHALYLAFEPDVRRAVKQFDSPAVRRLVRGMSGGNESGSRKQNRKPKRVRTGVVKAKVIPDSKAIPASETVIDAQWVAE